MTAEDTLDVLGDVPTATDINIYPGWNLVGYPATAERDLPGAFSAHGVADFSLVYAHHAAEADKWKLFDPGAPEASDLLALSPGWGYWINTGSAQDWTVAYPAP